jgi:hypothetical protein
MVERVISIFLVTDVASVRLSLVCILPVMLILAFRLEMSSVAVILDASGSMAYMWKYRDKYTHAKEILSYMNQTLPEIPLSCCVRSFGKKLWTLDSETTQVYKSDQYRTSEFEQALNKIDWPSGKTLLAQSLNLAEEYLKSKSGKIAILIVSDRKRH